MKQELHQKDAELQKSLSNHNAEIAQIKSNVERKRQAKDVIIELFIMS